MKRIFVTAVAALAVTAAAFFAACSAPVRLVLYNTETGQVYRSFAAEEGMEFSVEFIHSVNQSPVRDVFVIRDGAIVADRTIYAAFGAGVQSTLEEGQTLEYDSQGNMVVSGFDTVFPAVKYIVGTVSDHVLRIEGESISLTELCGKNAHIAFELR
ncbi:MAG: DUF1850 domain-containing protein [Eubacteriales bacterium]